MTLAMNTQDLEAAWKNLNDVIPLGPIRTQRDHAHRAKMLDALLDIVGANEKHALMPLVEIVARQIEEYEAVSSPKEHATPAEVLRFLMSQHGLTQTDLAAEMGGQSIVSGVLNGRRTINVRQAKALAHRFGVSPALFI